ncbi:MAG: T9SS type A sorting domain-containing protein [Ginsengibacter sp.]
MKKLLTLFFLSGILLSRQAFALPVLNSLPSAQATIFLDFDGHYLSASPWNSGNPLDCAASGLSDVQIEEIFNRVAEDFRPFDINITTDSTTFLSAPLTKRIRIIVTPTSSWYPNVGGVAFTGSFTWGDDTPAFVFPDKLGFKAKLVAECCTHESGHTLSLSHQAKYSGTCTLLATYNDGTGSGETGWAPVMGNSYYKNFSGWNNGPTPSSCSADQDNLSIITSYNGFTYRKDDHGDDPKLNSTATILKNNSFSDSGIITTNSDKDAFKITISKDSKFHLNVSPFSVGAANEGADLDVKITLLDAASQVLKVFSDSTQLNAVIDTVLTPGEYYVLVEGDGNNNASSYGSLGSYNITGMLTPLTITPVHQVLLAGTMDNTKHKFHWNIIADEPVKNLSLESSEDGTIFTTLSAFLSGSNEYAYVAPSKANIFYRLKVNSITGQTVYSNVIALKSGTSNGKQFKVSNLVHDYITVQADNNFSYQLVDLNGRMITSGNGQRGLNTIDINNRPNGMYFLQILNDEQRTTERIIRM